MFDEKINFSLLKYFHYLLINLNGDFYEQKK